MNSVASSSSSSNPPTKKPFPFFELPSELRIKIYQYVLFIEHGKGVVDLDRDNDRRIAPRLTCFRASRRMHDEAYPIFYGSPQQPFRLFPTGINELYRAKKSLLELLTPTYRAVVNTIELRLGPAWEKVSPGSSSYVQEVVTSMSQQYRAHSALPSYMCFMLEHLWRSYLSANY
jgi:hypothetical protein